MLWIEGGVALIFALIFMAYATFTLKPQHVAHHPMRVRIGAAIQGLTIGLVLGFIMVPIRLQVMQMRGDATHPPSGFATLSYLAGFALYMAIRRGALLKAPLISTYLRAYRRATLLKQVEDAQKNLSKLDLIEAKFA
jgi:hypothetical protein